MLCKSIANQAHICLRVISVYVRVLCHQARRLVDLAVVSVLLDAGAGSRYTAYVVYYKLMNTTFVMLSVIQSS
jgi:Protein of unknown function (DUF1688)